MNDDAPSLTTTTVAAHWHPMAQLWKLLGPPLRLSPEDVAGYRRFAWEWIDRNGPPRVLLLGVTPEIHGLPWPEGHDFVAADTSLAMIDHIWPGARDQVLHTDWLDLMLPPASRDLVLSDGGLNQVNSPAGREKLADLLHHILPRGGRFITRLYTLPTVAESPDAVIASLLAGEIANLNLLKLRLGMAMQESPAHGIAVREIYEKLRDSTSDWQTLAAQLGWPLDHLLAIEAYRDSGASYCFFSAGDVVKLFCESGKFALLGSHVAAYPLGERCPMMAFERL